MVGGDVDGPRGVDVPGEHDDVTDRRGLRPEVADQRGLAIAAAATAAADLRSVRALGVAVVIPGDHAVMR